MATYTTTPKDWTDGETPAAADFDDHLKAFANAFGAWGSYTPTLGGFTLGDGTVTGKYLQVQKTVIFRAKFTFGSTSAAASAYPTLTLPVTAASSDEFQGLTAGFRDTSPGVSYLAIATAGGSTSTVRLGIPGSSGQLTAPTTTTPFTWASGDSLFVAGTYECA